jgi:hypothetical protein
MNGFQEIFTPEPQTRMGFAEPAQNGLEFPMSLAEKYQPNRLDSFIGLERPKNLLANLVKEPRACSLLFIGPPGAGKTAMAMAFAKELGGSLKHLPSQTINVARLDRLRDELAYIPNGGWWIILGDEVDQITEQTQTQLLSRLDGTASLRPKFGGGFERGTPPPIIWIWTCNGKGEKQTDPPSSLLPRFQSRNMVIPFEAATEAELAAHLERIWNAEGGAPASPAYFAYMAKGVGVRDALMRLDTDLLAGPRPVPEPEPEEEEHLPRRPIKPRPKSSDHKVTSISTGSLSPAQRAWVTRRQRKATA